MRNVKTMSVCLPDELIEQLKRAAWNEGRSVSNYVTHILTEALSREEAADDAE